MQNFTAERQTKFVTEWLNFNIDRQPSRPYVPFDRWFNHQMRMRKEKGAKAHKNYRCRYCNRKLGEKLTKTIDHIAPTSRGGKNVADNKVVACEPCNTWKNDLTLEQWLEKLKKIEKKGVFTPPYNEAVIKKMINNIKRLMKDIKKNHKVISQYKV